MVFREIRAIGAFFCEEGLSISLVSLCKVFVKEFKAGVAIYLDQVIIQLLASFEYSVEFIITEPYPAVVFDCASVVHFADICPHTGAQAHMARLSGCV